jgi:hypothetical protein
MTPRPLKFTLTLQIDDRGATLRTPDGTALGVLPEIKPGPGRRSAWASALRELAPAGTEVQLLLGQLNVSVECQDAPYLSHREQREVATRIAAAEEGAQPLASAAALDTDAGAEGGHVLWVATVPQADLYDWLGALEGAGLSLVFAAPFQRALLCGLEHSGELPQSSLVLALNPGVEGHILIFRGRSLVLVRNFRLPETDPDASELIFEEVSRLLQFFKQKQRGATFEKLHVVGVPALAADLANRLQGALRLGVKVLAPALWPVLQRGLQVERARRNGLNLVPQEVQDAQQLRIFRGTVWIAAGLMMLLLLVGTLFLQHQEEGFRQAAEAAEQRLAEREAKTSDEGRIIQARIPILRLRAAEKRQAEASRTLARISALLLKAPPDIQLEKVEVVEIAGDKVAHRFTVTGLAFTESRFSVGPLALYLQSVGKEPGVTLAPVSEISVSDRTQDQGTEKPEQKAVTRFTLQGTAP